MPPAPALQWSSHYAPNLPALRARGKGCGAFVRGGGEMAEYARGPRGEGGADRTSPGSWETGRHSQSSYSPQESRVNISVQILPFSCVALSRAEVRVRIAPGCPSTILTNGVATIAPSASQSKHSTGTAPGEAGVRARTVDRIRTPLGWALCTTCDGQERRKAGAWGPGAVIAQ